MKLETHILQNFAPANLNRDDTGAPKDCLFGGHRRARISSQCLKRAMRQAFVEHDLLGPEGGGMLAARTKRLVDSTARILAAGGRDESEARQLTAFALQSAKLKVDEEHKTEYLLYLPSRTIRGLAACVEGNWETLGKAATAEGAAPEESGPGKKKTKKAAKRAAKAAVPAEVTRAVTAVLADGSKTPDLALFGRMIADNPDWNLDASCQVAHAISTNKLTTEFDFFTAVDDLRPKETAGSDMMGTVAFQSSCFYRYACLDVDALRRNLGAADEEEADDLVRRTVEAFLRASAMAVPTGKQNSMAAQNRPSYLLATVRTRGVPLSLANAFLAPVRPQKATSLVEDSVRSLEEYLDRSLALWGDDLVLIACGEGGEGISSRPVRAPSFEDWIEEVVRAVGSER